MKETLRVKNRAQAVNGGSGLSHVGRTLCAIGALVLAGLLFLPFLSLSAQQSGPPADGQGQTENGGQISQDSQIESDVINAINASPTLQSEHIVAATAQGVVTLYGQVTSEQVRKQAESTVAQVKGVARVNNKLQIAGSQPADAMQAGGMAGPPPADDESSNQAGQPDQSTQQNVQSGGAQNQPYPSNGQPAARPQYQPGQSQPGYGAPPPAYAQQPPQSGGQQYGAPQQQAPQYSGPYDPTPVTIPQGTLLQLRTAEPLDSKHAENGTLFQLTVIRDVYVGSRLAIPRGATVHGVVMDSRQSGDLGGSPELALRLLSIDLGGRNYKLVSDEFKVRGPNKAGYSASNIVGGAGLGAIIGAIAGRGAGAAIGAAVGATAGTAVSAATPGPRAWIPAEALVTFHLVEPVTVVPVTPGEAQRLAQSVTPGGPNLYRRGPGYGAGYGYAAPPPYPLPPPPPYPAAYPYPPPPPQPFYHTYYVSGGYYYWR
jgi:hypothetical protein